MINTINKMFFIVAKLVMSFNYYFTVESNKRFSIDVNTIIKQYDKTILEVTMSEIIDLEDINNLMEKQKKIEEKRRSLLTKTKFLRGRIQNALLVKFYPDLTLTQQIITEYDQIIQQLIESKTWITNREISSIANRMSGTYNKNYNIPILSLDDLENIVADNKLDSNRREKFKKCLQILKRECEIEEGSMINVKIRVLKKEIKQLLNVKINAKDLQEIQKLDKHMQKDAIINFPKTIARIINEKKKQKKLIEKRLWEKESELLNLELMISRLKIQEEEEKELQEKRQQVLVEMNILDKKIDVLIKEIQEQKKRC